MNLSGITFRKKLVLVTITSTFLFGLLLVLLGRNWLSERFFSKARDLAIRDQGKETLQFLKIAIRLNPKDDVYRLSLAQASLALANELLAKEKPDEARIESLIKQAVEEGKRATELGPEKATNWVGLGNIYKFLGNVPGAQDWAVKCFKRAIEIEPKNALTYELLASVYFAQGKLEEAKTELETALSLTPENSKDFRRIKRELEKLK
jgi:tetratricopeptide (TPR) repeat protein